MGNRPRRQRTKKRAKPKADRPGLSLTRFGVPPEKHGDFKKAIKEAAKESVDAFPETLERLSILLKIHSPEGVLATFAMYGLQAMVGKDGLRAMLPDLLQHHAELLQAIVLTIPAADWGPFPSKPDIMTTFFDDVPKLSEAFGASDLSWDGHCWIVLGKWIADVSICRTAKSGRAPPALARHMRQAFEAKTGLLIQSAEAAAEMGLFYRPRYVLTSDQIDGLARGARAVLESHRSPGS